jgi:hypothetical protein
LEEIVMISLQSLIQVEPGLATAAVVFVTLYVVLYKLQSVKTHPNEPPIISSRIPFLGPLVGMALKGGKHVKEIG